jgi:hypothetical protein
MEVQLNREATDTAAGKHNFTITCFDDGEPALATTVTVSVTITRANRPPGRAVLLPLRRFSNQWLVHHDENAFAAIDGTDPDGHADILRFDLIDSSHGAFVLEQGMLRLGQYGDPVSFDNTTRYAFVIRTTDRSGEFTDTRFEVSFSSTDGGVVVTPVSVGRRAALDELGGEEELAEYMLGVPARLLDRSWVNQRPQAHRFFVS